MKKWKHAVHIIYNKDKFTHSKPLMRDMNALNVYQINIFQVLKLMNKSTHKLNPRVFDNMFTEIHHGYPLRFSRSNFNLLVGQRLGIITYMNLKKKNWSLPLFIHKLKIKLLESEDELTFFGQTKLQLILTLSFICFFTIGIFKYGCAFKLVLCLYVYIYIYIYIFHGNLD